MFKALAVRLGRPREIMWTPPPLAKHPGKFKCRVCRSEWESTSVWVTKTTQRCYQGETCEQCGTSNKPYYIGRFEESIFNRVSTPHPVKPGASTKRAFAKLKHGRFHRRVQRTH